MAPVAAKKKCSITCEATPITADQSTKISVNLTDAATGDGLERRFRLYYSMDGGNSWKELGLGVMGWGALWTDEDGEFSNWWRPPGHLPHDYLLKAHWEGDETYDGCTVIQTLTINLPPDAPLVIENVRSFVSDTTHYIVGEIRNTGGDNLENVKVAVGYYNATGDTIDAEISYIPIDILTPGQISPFMFDRTPSAEVSEYEVVVSRFSVTEEEPYTDFEFSSHRSYSKYGYHHVVGLVKNIGSMNAKSVKVLAIFYDASDRLLGYGTGSALRSILIPGEKSPFDASSKLVEAHHHYTLVVAEAKNTTDQPYTQLQIVSHSGRISDSKYRVSGVVENIGPSCVEGVKVIAAFYDANGTVVNCDYDGLGHIIPGQTSEFEVYTSTVISKIQQYELWAECREKAWWYEVLAGGMTWKVFITSNSSYVGDFSFDRQTKTITFNVTGYSGIGWCRAVVPKLLLGGPFTVLVDGATVTHTQTENDTHTLLSFTYQHSEHTVEIVGTTVVKEESQISCSVEPASTRITDISTRISGYISPQVDEAKSVPITIQYSPDGVVWFEIATVTSSSIADYQYDWSPTLTVGTYYVRAMWDGSTTYLNATSETALFNVTKAKTTISVSVSKTTITEGDEVTVSASINATVSGKIVTLTYEKPDGSTFNRTVTTESDGSYSDAYKPDATGSWSVSARWSGDENYKEATSETKSFTVKKKEEEKGGICFIATATYGSELSPEVQFLRRFRDQNVMSTFAGYQFMKVFNGIYYSFSPTVASVISGSEVIRGLMKVVLYPLMGVLHLGVEAYSVFSFSPDLGILVFCLVVSSLMSIVYLVPWALLFSFLKKKVVSVKKIRMAGLVWAGSITLMFVAKIAESPLLMMSSGGVFVLATTCLTTLAVVRAITKQIISKTH